MTATRMVKVGAAVVDPTHVIAVARTDSGARILLDSGGDVWVEGLTVDQVLDRLDARLAARLPARPSRRPGGDT